MLTIHNISKAYKRYPRKYGRMAEWLGLGAHHEAIWVLRDVSFEVPTGQAVGIVGVNGAGKSTLLKIVTGTTRPTSGHVQTAGRISALLELGMGFHGDFTGRQNCYMSGQLQGLTSAEVDTLIPDIAEFAEIGDYFDQPVRTYSSGMQVRLAFSLATARRPEVLIVDEALSVGDAYFQHKSFDRIRRFRRQGTTLLFVSHDRAAVVTLCDRALLLQEGRVIKDGAPQEVTDFYNALIAEKGNATVKVAPHASGAVQTVSGTGEARVESIGLYNRAGQPVDMVAVGEALELRVHVRLHAAVDTLVLGYAIKDRLGQYMYGTNTWYTRQVVHQPVAGQIVAYHIRFNARLGVGSYSVVTSLSDQQTHLTANYEWRELALVFTVYNADQPEFIGCAWIEPVIEIDPA